MPWNSGKHLDSPAVNFMFRRKKQRKKFFFFPLLPTKDMVHGKKDPLSVDGRHKLHKTRLWLGTTGSRNSIPGWVSSTAVHWQQSMQCAMSQWGFCLWVVEVEHDLRTLFMITSVEVFCLGYLWDDDAGFFPVSHYFTLIPSLVELKLKQLIVISVTCSLCDVRNQYPGSFTRRQLLVSLRRRSVWGEGRGSIRLRIRMRCVSATSCEFRDGCCTIGNQVVWAAQYSFEATNRQTLPRNQRNKEPSRIKQVVECKQRDRMNWKYLIVINLTRYGL